MYVLVDIEWAINHEYRKSLTQIAAARVDEKWNVKDSYFSLIRPQNSSFHDWSQVCYSGAKESDFRQARSAYDVLSEFEEWLRMDDILLFWYKESVTVYNFMHKILFKTSFEYKELVLVDYAAMVLDDGLMRRGNPYHLAQKRGIKTPHEHHISSNDVEAMRCLLCEIKMPQVLLEEPAKPVEHKKNEHKNSTLPFQYDEVEKLLHKAECPRLHTSHSMQSFATLASCIKKKLRPCEECLGKEYREARFAGFIDRLNRCQYNYIYIPSSRVFHKPSCHLVYNTNDTIMGTVTFDRVKKTRRRPCKICKPTADDPKREIPIDLVRRGAEKARQKAKRDLTKEEKKALGRHKIASEERARAFMRSGLSETEKNDIYTLTQPEFSFWAGAGYKTFHLRHCSKLNSLSNIKGFKHYQQAIGAGFKPCKHCKPSAKHDVDISIPIGNMKRENDTVENLIELCIKHGFTYEEKNAQFIITTQVGKWSINTQISPIQVEHMNLVVNDGEFHRQPRLFLSLIDTFFYIERHDKTLMEKQNDDNQV